MHELSVDRWNRGDLSERRKTLKNFHAQRLVVDIVSDCGKEGVRRGFVQANTKTHEGKRNGS